MDGERQEEDFIICAIEGGAAMELMDKILSQKNLQEAMKRVKSNKGASGIDKMSVEEIDEYFSKHIEEIKTSIWEKKYRPQAVKRVYIQNHLLPSCATSWRIVLPLPTQDL